MLYGVAYEVCGQVVLYLEYWLLECCRTLCGVYLCNSNMDRMIAADALYEL